MKKIYFLLVLTFLSFSGYSQTSTFSYTGGLQYYTIPSGVFSITVDVQGAKGGGVDCYSSFQTHGGCGGRVQAALAVTPGDVLKITVGQQGNNTTGAGGYGGGGSDATYWTGAWPGAGGGGATTIYDNTSGVTVVVAGGGGGGGGGYCPGTTVGTGVADAGGAGGGTTAAPGNCDLCGLGLGGGGGTPTAGGGAGACGGCTGSAGTAGAGANVPSGACDGSGGGGGGWYGGGSGAEGGGGGGGSSYTNSSATSVIHTQGYNCGDGIAIIGVNCSAGLIYGITTICLSDTSTLTDPITGGTWSSSNTAVATIGSTGFVTAVSTGTTMITYTAALACGTVYTTAVVTVNPTPTTIAGTLNVCIGRTTTLTGVVAATSWTSSTTTVATIGSLTGIVTGVAAGTTIITYSDGGVGMACAITTTVTVNSLPVSISGTLHVCVGLTTILSDGTVGGSWTSSSTGIATIGSSSGIVTGIAAGTTIITYTLSTGCITTSTLTVNPLPAAITGTFQVCAGLTTTLSDITTLGTWSSSNTIVATVGSVSGIVSGLVAGTTIITYTIPTGCINIATVTVNPLPAAITGGSYLCPGTSSTLTDITGGGTWSSGNITIATVGSSTGIVTGIGAGTTNITYTLTSTGCLSTIVVTVNPFVPIITGVNVVCAGSTTFLSDGTSGGTWTSSNTAVVTIGSISGVVSGLVAGTTIITYSMGTGCFNTTIVTVYPLPSIITGYMQVCEGLDTTLADSTAGGSWSSSNIYLGSISSAGQVAGLYYGTITITYTLSTGCYSTVSFTVNPVPNPITGLSSLCLGYTTTLSDTLGVWSSSNTTVATIGSSTGIVDGLALGSAIMTYTLPTSCIATLPVTVYPNPSPITGSSLLCVGASTTLSDGSGGGTWTSSNSAVAPIVGSLGFVTGLTAGTTIITYTLSTGCFITATLTVVPAPGTIGGPSSLCVGANVTLTDVVTGGVWTSSNITTASIGSSSGIVTGNVVGTAIITYSLGGSCRTTRTESVTAGAAAITGTLSICAGTSTSLSDVTAGGTWSSSNTVVATVGSSTGVVTGIVAGTATISYTLATGCSVTKNVTVNPTPGPITGVTGVCVGLSTTLGNTVAGGTWISSNTTVATIGSSSGIVNGLVAGTSLITYSLGGSCIVTATLTVHNNPANITGSSNVCVGGTTNLADATAGGTWSSSSITNATIGSTGVVSGVATGTAIITYTLATGCMATATIQVNPSPTPITGLTSACTGTTDTLTDGSSGGTWTSSTITVATVGSGSGVVTAVIAGSSTITYSLAYGCATTRIVTIFTAPTAITGPTAVCAGDAISLGDGVAGGTWASSSTGVATIGSGTGILTGSTLGTTIVTYSVAGFCLTTTTITVSPSPTAIIGPPSLCQGATITYSDLVPGGLWYSSNLAVATVGSTTGAVLGVSVGSSVITYSLGAGCITTKTINVTTAPSNITGTMVLCAGTSVTLADGTTGGTWSSGNIGVAQAGSSTGVVTGVIAGTALISYSLSTGCSAVAAVTVNLAPAAISGAASVCQGSAITLTDAIGPGTWSSSLTGIATIDSAGDVTGVAAGSSIITYIISTGCYVTRSITVNPIAAISGVSVLCIGNTATLTDAVTGGTWLSGNTAVATIGASTGLLTGMGTGTTIVTYTLSTGCTATTTITVSPTPTAISGSLSMCAMATSLLSDGIGGGTWTSTTITVATVGSSTGLVTGVATGTSVITYSLGSGCIAMKTVTILPSPTAISGPVALCVSSTMTLTDGVSGGVWTSTTTGVATINSTSGLVTGISLGTSVISYALSGGCNTSTTITVSPTPTAIIGDSILCSGASENLSDFVTGGSWLSTNTLTAGIGSISGVVTGITSGTSIITYSLGSGCLAVKTLTVIPSPVPISGPNNVCVGSTITETDATSVGDWLSGTTSVATIGLTTGVITGVLSGTTIITYTTSNTCFTVKTITVNPLPNPETGTFTVCTGFTTLLGDLTAGGSWSSGSTGIATVISTSGLVSGLAPGTSSIIYTTAAGCAATAVVTVNPTPSNITGPASVCVGSVIFLNDISTAGIWTTSSATIAIGSISGIVTGIAAGPATVSYTLAAGCQVTKSITVNPSPGPINGVLSVCTASSTALTDTSAGGVWSISSGIASIGSSSGIVSGFTAGMATISYSLPGGCYSLTTLTVYPTPSNISGPAQVCAGSSIAMTDLTSGGLWSSGSIGVATISSTGGVVTGVAAGVATISYSLSAGCLVTKTITVNTTPTPITGTTNMCVHTSANYTDTVPGGQWTSSNTAVATIGLGTGIINALISGTTTITYSLPTGCFVSQVLTVNPTATAITGNTNICTGVTSTLSNSISGGTWVSSTGAAIIGSSSGSITGVFVGSSVITYTIGAGCTISATVTVYPSPASITGVTNLCQNSSLIATDGTPGGRWASSNALVAPVGSVSGLVTGLAAGTAIISYIMPSGCSSTASLTVFPVASITGSTNLCVSGTTTLGSTISGGLWSTTSSSISIGSSSGIVSGISAGTSMITYTTASGCISTLVITSNPLPGPITGPANLCVTQTTTLGNSSAGGTWSSTITGVATISSLSGFTNAVASGNTTISYTLPTGCSVSSSLTVNPLPLAISGVSNPCLGSTLALTDATPLGIWSSGSLGVATIGSTTGIISSVTSGVTVITYTLPTGCYTTATVTINPVPLSILGAAQVCQGQTTTLTDPTPGGLWSSSAFTASINSASGLVTGMAPGTALISYVLPTGCMATTTFTVIPIPVAIIDSPNVCVGTSITLFDATTGGTWSSGNPTVGSITPLTGIFSGLSSGTVLVYYTLGTGCGAVSSIIVNPVSPISGPTSVCVGQAITLSDTTLDGTWSSSSSTIAVAISTGDSSATIYGALAGTSIISYLLPTGCTATYPITVNPIPGAILGPNQVCQFASITLVDLSGVGLWTSGSTGIATVTPTAGVVTGVTPGTALISYSVSGCPATKVITVNPLPSPITGSTNVCVGSSTTLTDATTGGAWASGSPLIASIGAFTGVLSGVSAGTATIIYTDLATNCATRIPVIVNPNPLPITGGSNICMSSSAFLADATPGGVWTSSSSVATIDYFTGYLTGLVGGTATITYTVVSTGCYITRLIDVDTLPAAITGPAQVCVNATATLHDATSGGIWTSGATTLATIGSHTGIVTGVSAGLVSLTYSDAAGCIASTFINVNPIPLPITGFPKVCVGATTNLFDATPTGSWSPVSGFIASVDTASGLVTGNNAGIGTISYILPVTGCFVTTTVAVYPNPVTPTGNPIVCLGSTTTLSESVPGGTWSSSNVVDAPIGSLSGVVSGLGLGTAIIVYVIGPGCSTYTTVTVVPLPSIYSVTGGGDYCNGGTGVPLGISGSSTGVNYMLYRGSTAVGAFAGTGSVLPFGLQTVGGTYHVVATSTYTGCTNLMSGTKTVIVDPNVIPSVGITSGVGDTVCAGTSTTFTALPDSGGTAPTYEWNINGTNVSTGLTYTFVPADGDDVKVTMTSNAHCASPATVNDSLKMHVFPAETPYVGISADPSDTVCKGIAVSLSAIPAYGGSAPTYYWVVDGYVAGIGATFAYIPSNKDSVYCVITSNFPCLAVDTAKSIQVLMTVDTPLIPHVNINANPGFTVGPADNLTLTAVVTDAGMYPTYQWLINSVPVIGATNQTFTHSGYDSTFEDSVSVIVTSSGVCPMSTHNWAYIRVSSLGVNNLSFAGSSIRILPNPNKGEFTITGSTGNMVNDEVTLEITDVVGQVVFKDKLQITNGKIFQKVKLDNNVANGMYILNLRSDTDNLVFHMVVEQ